jgi:uncharacterized protein (TIGR03435 family)
MAIAPALGNHLWQSTLCIVIAGLLTLVLRKNHARARYGLWLAASVKFLVPFSLLIAIGSHLARPRALPSTERGFFFAMEEVGQPFTKAAAGSQAAEKSRGPAQDAGPRYRLVHLLPAVLVALWLSGFMTVLFVWYARWRRVSVAMRDAAPLREGHEVEALRRAERLGGIRKPLELLLSPVTLEPGIFGIVKPVLVWPKGLSERLDDALLEAILAHEVWHVRRRDNLTAAIHMAVEAFFWFHPLVWWLGSRLMEERERACDEEVLESGGERQVYAESILRTCEFCVESPLACVSGVTGADLKKRIVRIMTERMANKLSFGRKLVLAAFGIGVIAGPVVFGFVNVPQMRAQSTQTTGAPLPSFEVATVKPSPPVDMVKLAEQIKAGKMPRFGPHVNASQAQYTYMSLKELIAAAYTVREYQITGPAWLATDRFDIVAKLPHGASKDDAPKMLQALLAERFKLAAHRDTQEHPVLALVVGKDGPKLKESPGTAEPIDENAPLEPGETQMERPSGPIRMTRNDDGSETMNMGAKGTMTVRVDRQAQTMHLESSMVTMAGFADMLTMLTHIAGGGGRQVVDMTGLKGNYEVALDISLAEVTAMAQAAHREAGISLPMPPAGGGAENNSPASAASEPIGGSSVFASVQKLGLKLEKRKAAVEQIVIDHVERPSEN